MKYTFFFFKNLERSQNWLPVAVVIGALRVKALLKTRQTKDKKEDTCCLQHYVSDRSLFNLGESSINSISTP